MALSLATLEQELLDRVFKPEDISVQGDFTAIGEAWADALETWYADAENCNAAGPAGLAAAAATLRTAIPGVFSASVDPATTAMNLGAAIEAFYVAAWLPLVAAPVVGTLKDALLAQWASIIPTVEQAAQIHASIIQANAVTVIVSVPAIPCSGPVA